MSLIVGMNVNGFADDPSAELESLSFQSLIVRAESGDERAQNNLGLRYRDGINLEEDEAKAVEWFRRAADQGDAEAMDHLGFMHLKGRGLVEDRKVAVGYFQSSAAKGFASAMYNLGDCYFSGLGVEQNYQLAVEQWQAASKLKHRGSIWRLALMYATGESVPKDREKAMVLCRDAAKGGHMNAALLMGELEMSGGNVKEAYKWWKEAAKLGSPHAKTLLEIDGWRRAEDVPGKHAYVEVDHIYQGWNNCGATSVSMFLRYLGADLTPYDVKRLCPENPIGVGTDWQDLLAVSNEVDQKWDLVTFDYTDDGFDEGAGVIRNHLDAGHPVVIDFTIVRIENGEEKKHGHTLTVVGYHKEKDLFVLNNPNQPSPGIQLKSSEELKKSWYSTGYSRLSKGRAARPLIVVAQ